MNLLQTDRKLLMDAVYYFDYAIGMYGWKMYCFEKPFTGWFGLARQTRYVIFSTTMGNLLVRVLVCVGACVHAFVPVCVHAWVCPYFSVCRHAWVCPYVSVCVHVLCWLASMLTMPFGKPQD